MSSFDGLFEEIPLISADCFINKNFKSKIFFLSHCHTDHMTGLKNLSSFKLPGPLYTSPASSVFLKKQFSHLNLDIHILNTFCPEQIDYEDEVNHKKYSLLVTTLPARHCPGSVMFLFQTKTCNILYTGDFRFELIDLNKNFQILQDDIEIDVVYMDSTFLNKDYKEFPRQLESINKIIEIINKWLQKDLKNQIQLILPAQYGAEYLFIEIYRKLNEKIFINDHQEEKYIYFSNMDECVSTQNNNCRIKVINKKDYKCYNCSSYNCIIRPTAMYWKNWTKGKEFVEWKNPDENSAAECRVAFSYHSSLHEIKDFLNFIKPKKVKLNVLPKSDKDIRELFNTLKEIYPFNAKNNQKTINMEAEKVIRFDNIFLIRNTKLKHEEHHDDDKNKCSIMLPKRVKM